MTDHKANAERALDRVQNFHPGESDDWPAVNATVAQAEATLALVEQQRIANLIALARAEATDERHEKELFFAIYTHSPSPQNGYVPRSWLNDALGLA